MDYKKVLLTILKKSKIKFKHTSEDGTHLCVDHSNSAVDANFDLVIGKDSKKEVIFEMTPRQIIKQQEKIKEAKYIEFRESSK